MTYIFVRFVLRFGFVLSCSGSELNMHNAQHEGVIASELVSKKGSPLKLNGVPMCADTSGFSLDFLVLCGNGMQELVL